MDASTGSHIELRFPNRPEFVGVARLTVAGVAARMNFDVNAVEDLKVAVAEACTNAIEHGCPAEQGTIMITVRCEMQNDALVVTVHDPGDGFDPSTASRQHRHSTMTLSEGGLGMLLIEALVDDVEFSSTPGDGTQVRMVKRLRAAEVEAS